MGSFLRGIRIADERLAPPPPSSPDWLSLTQCGWRRRPSSAELLHAKSRESTMSFPRKRESRVNSAIFWMPACAGMTMSVFLKLLRSDRSGIVARRARGEIVAATVRTGQDQRGDPLQLCRRVDRNGKAAVALAAADG